MAPLLLEAALRDMQKMTMNARYVLQKTGKAVFLVKCTIRNAIGKYT